MALSWVPDWSWGLSSSCSSRDRGARLGGVLWDSKPLLGQVSISRSAPRRRSGAIADRLQSRPVFLRSADGYRLRRIRGGQRPHPLRPHDGVFYAAVHEVWPLRRDRRRSLLVICGLQELSASESEEWPRYASAVGFTSVRNVQSLPRNIRFGSMGRVRSLFAELPLLAQLLPSACHRNWAPWFRSASFGKVPTDTVRERVEIRFPAFGRNSNRRSRRARSRR